MSNVIAVAKEHPDPPMSTLDVNPHEVPAGTTTLFGLLITAVLATTSIVYTTLYLALPSHFPKVVAVIEGCVAREPLLGQPISNGEDLRQHSAASTRFNECAAPLYADQALWVAIGIAALLVLTFAFYWFLPGFIIRRHSLKPVSDEDSAGLLGYLSELSLQFGLARPPTFLIGPSAQVSGMTFGRLRRRYVQLDTGLITTFTTDRATFRVVVLHELAHLRNRDVDKTYIATTVWWSFVIIALAPLIVVLALSDVSLFLNLGLSLLTLTALVYLARTAILREREIYADARVAEFDPGSADILRSRVSELSHSPGGRWRIGVLSTHPETRRRLEVIDDATALLRPRRWELLGAGLAVAAVAANVNYFAPTTTLSPWLVLVSVVVSSPLVLLLAIATWREVARSPKLRVPLHRKLVLSALLTAGFLAGEQLALTTAIDNALFGWARLLRRDTVGPAILSVLLLLLGTWLLAGWMASAIGWVMSHREHHRRIVLVLITVGAIAGTPFLSIWLAFHRAPILLELLFGWAPGAAPAQGATIHWYSELIRWTGLAYPPMDYVLRNPFALLGLALLWFVPIIATTRGWSAASKPTSRLVASAFIGGIAGGVVYALVCVGILFALRVSLPAAVVASDGYMSGIPNVLIATAIAFEAVVAVAMTVVLSAYRSVLVPLAVFLAGTIATAALAVATAAGSCLSLFGGDSGRCSSRSFGPAFLAETMQTIVILGMLAPIPVALLVIAIRSAIPHMRQKDLPLHDDHSRQAGSSRDVRSPLRMSGISAVALMTMVITAAALGLPRAHQQWFPGPPAFDQCVIGTWEETFRQQDATLSGIGATRFTGKGGVHKFRPDGIVSLDFGSGSSDTASADGRTFELISTGTIAWRYQTVGGRLLYSDVKAVGSMTLKVDGRVSNTIPLEGSQDPEDYACTEASMKLSGDGSTVELRRISHSAS